MTDPRCGSLAGYNVHTYRLHEPACPACLTAKADWMRHYRTRKYLARGPLTVDATGTRRRLQALMRIGWSSTKIAAEFDVSSPAVRDLLLHRRVFLATAARVAALYDRWWNVPGPAVRTANMAKANGWPPPLAWDDDTIDDPRARPSTGLDRDAAAFDEIAMERAMYDAAVPLRPAERAEVVRRLTRAGLSAAQIAQRLDTTPRSVTRWRGKAAS